VKSSQYFHTLSVMDKEDWNNGMSHDCPRGHNPQGELVHKELTHVMLAASVYAWGRNGVAATP